MRNQRKPISHPKISGRRITIAKSIVKFKYLDSVKPAVNPESQLNSQTTKPIMTKTGTVVRIPVLQIIQSFFNERLLCVKAILPQ